jgi:acyl-CoA thioesterase FadM
MVQHHVVFITTRRQPFDAMKPAITSPPIVTHRGFVSPIHLEPTGQMTLPFQLARCEEASWQLLARLGCGPRALQREQRGVLALEQSMTHHALLHTAALLHVESELLEIGSRGLRCRHRLCDTEAQRALSTMDVLLGLVSLGQRTLLEVPRELMWRAQSAFPNAVVRAQSREATGSVTAAVPT